jgi:hypothetical protein
MAKWLITVTLLLPLALVAQNAPGGKSLASTLDVYVFPSKGQDSSQQSKDESTCYQWAVTNSGVDPFNLQKQAESDQEVTDAQMQAAQSTGTGRGAEGLVRGAMAGALIGGIANGRHGARHGAAWGAGLGLIAGRARGRSAQRQEEASASSAGAARSAATAQELDNFKKAYSVCLESKNYMVKY